MTVTTVPTTTTLLYKRLGEITSWYFVVVIVITLKIKITIITTVLLTITMPLETY